MKERKRTTVSACTDARPVVSPTPFALERADTVRSGIAVTGPLVLTALIVLTGVEVMTSGIQ